MKKRCAEYFFKLLLVLFMVLRLSAAHALSFLLPQASEIYGFGSFFLQSDSLRSSYGKVPQSGIELGMPPGEIRTPASGAVVYLQRELPLNSSFFSFPLGNAVAIEHPEKYVSIIAGLGDSSLFRSISQPASSRDEILRVGEKTILSSTAGSGVFKSGFFDVALYDTNNKLWVNPIFLAPWIIDRTAPIIRSVTLTRMGIAGAPSIELAASRGAKETTISCQQGNYEIAVDAYDTLGATTSLHSVPYRFAAVLDGKTVLDTPLLGAKRNDNGLSFLNNPAPSQNAVTSNGLLKIGSIMLPRGEHDLIVQISDYSGNMSATKSRLAVY